MTDAANANEQMETNRRFARPEEQLHDYPVEYCWEITRRHPYYLVFWLDALLYRQGEMGSSPKQQLFRYSATLMLGMIGVTGEPQDPATDFENLDGEQSDPAFLSASVQPMTLRAVAGMLINALPPAERAAVGAILNTSGSREYAIADDDDLRTEQKMRAISRLGQIPSSALDSYPVAPLFYIHLGASLRTISRDLKDQIQAWKKRQGIPERRVHTKKLDQYLRIWDLREGWTGSSYDRSREHTFRRIAEEERIGLATVVSRYRTAFEIITGHPFSPLTWARLFGLLKLSDVFGDPAAEFSAGTRRLLQSPIRRPVPDTLVTPPTEQAHGIGTVEYQSAIEDHAEVVDLLLDLEDLVAQGLSDEEIAQRMEWDDPAIVTYYRTRTDELRGLQSD